MPEVWYAGKFNRATHFIQFYIHGQRLHEHDVGGV